MAQHYPVKPFCTGSVRKQTSRLGNTLRNFRHCVLFFPPSFLVYVIILKHLDFLMLPKRKLSYAVYISGILKNTTEILQKTPIQTTNPFSPIIFISKTLDAIILIYCSIMFLFFFFFNNLLYKKTYIRKKTFCYYCVLGLITYVTILETFHCENVQLLLFVELWSPPSTTVKDHIEGKFICE